MRLCEKNASELISMLRKKECSAREITEDVLKRIDKTRNLNTYISINENALKNADSIDALIAEGCELPILAGIPVAVKDNISVKGMKMTCGSKMLQNYVAPYDSEAADRLKKAGAVLIGKTNMDEFGMGSASDTSVFGAVRNPVNADFSAGGSSGGSAAAVRSCSAVLALGSDTGGSVRQPSAFCGTVGFKPTYGTVSRYGLTAFASSLEQIGSIGRNCADTALLQRVICGYDSKDAVTAKYFSFSPLDENLKMNGIRAAVPRELFSENISDEVKTAVETALKLIEKNGAAVEFVDIPSLDYAVNAYYIISSAEASSNLSRFDGVRFGYRAENCTTLSELYERSRSEGFGKEVKRRIMLGTFVLTDGCFEAYYKRAVLAAKRITADISDILENYDIIVSPVYPTPPFLLGDKISPLQRYAADICTVSANLSGLPAVSLPCGKSRNELPIGIQFMGRRFADSRLLSIAAAFEKLNGGLC